MRLRPFLGFGALTLVACNMTAFTANQTAPVLAAAQPAFSMESDPQLAREAAPGQLKTVEGFHLASPENKTFIAILAQGYCEYAFGFLESDIEEANFAGRTDEAERIGKRATGLFLRCMNYGLDLLGSEWKKALYANDPMLFEKKVKAAGKGSVQGMFWTALGMASAINLNRDDIDMVAYLPKAKLLFERISVLDPNYYNGGANMALGMLYTAQGAALGGNPTKGRELFEKAVKASNGRFLMPQVLMAVNYGVITQDREFFHKTLVKVLQTSPAIWPDQRLANELAHIRAKRYLAHEQELFE
jgi:hypothetical protein